MGKYDVVAVADFNEGSAVVSQAAEALAGWVANGQRIGLVQASLGGREVVAPLALSIRACLDRQQARLILPDEQVRVPTVVVWWPDDRRRLKLPAIETQRVVVVSETDEPTSDRPSAQEVGHVLGLDLERFPPPTVVTTAARALVSTAPPATALDEQTVLMISSNGTGMGHLTRLLAYARRASEGVRPHFLSLSQAVPVVAEFGYPYEYSPSVAPTGMAPNRWRTYLARRLAEAIERLAPHAVVFDGAWAYESIDEVRRTHDNVRWVWSRRGMWYRGMNSDQIAKAAWFDEVLEPGDFAAPADLGATSGAPAVRVGPVTVLDHEELLSRADARAALALDATMPTALVTLGAGNVNDPSSEVRVVIDALRALGMGICVTVPAIAERASTDDKDVQLVTTYPLARYLRAFDVAVSAAGYNSFHELLRFGVPTLFLPNLQTSLDDQRTRARYAADQGWARCLETGPTQPDVARALESLLDFGDEMVARVAEIDPGNGASQAMDVIAGNARRVA